MTPERQAELRDTYRDGLLHDTLPFWLRHGVDREHGGFLLCQDRDGTVIDTDKGLWQQCRFTWLLATLYHSVEKRPEWLELARHGIDFIRRHGFDGDGRMFFVVTRDGRPLRKRRYVFTECFAVAALAAYAKAAGDEEARDQAQSLFRLVARHLRTPGLIAPKTDPETRPMKGLGGPMIGIVTAQILRSATQDPMCDEMIEGWIQEIERDFMKPEQQAVLEVVGAKGEVLDHFDGRILNPGHALEAAWFLMEEARHRGGDRHLLDLGTTMVDWMWARGWDADYGGILYYTDLKGLPVQEYWHDMKFWWPQCEAILATLMAWRMTGDSKYAEWHGRIHDWAYGHFPDPEFGEWFGYLHRDGRLSSRLKGNLWKGPFHLPRMQLAAWKLLEG